MTRHSVLKRALLRDPAVRAAYEAMDEEFSLLRTMAAARARSGLTQEQVAARMGTTQSVVARLENGRGKPSLRTLERYARATGSRLKVVLEAAE